MGTLRIRTTFALCLAAAVVQACPAPERLPPPDDKPPASFPIIDAFTVDDPTIAPGESTVLRYAVRNADVVSIAPDALGVTDVLSGEVTVGPLDGDTTFTLVASSEAGDTRRTVVVSVGTGEVSILEFTADPGIIAPGSSSTLRWRTAGATAVTIQEQGGAVLVPAAAATGEVMVTPTANTTYEIVAEGKGGPVRDTTNVFVGTEPTVVRFEANPSQTTGGPTTLSWEVSNATSVEITDTQQNVVLTNGPVTGTRSVTPADTTTYMLVANGEVGSDVATVTVTVLEPGSPRIVEFTVTPTALAAPGNVTVTWNTADADTVDLHGDGTPIAAFPRTPSGSTAIMLASTVTLTLVAENGQGETTQDVTVTVGTPDTTAPTIDHTPPTGSITEGTALPLAATVSDADSSVGTVTLFYRTEGATPFSSVTMVEASAGRYEATIGANDIQLPGLEYYIRANDTATTPNAATNPPGAPANLHSVTVQPDDMQAPTIAHTEVPQDQQEGAAVMVTAVVTDASGLSEVTLYYKRSQDTLFTSVEMTASGTTYSVQIPAAAVLPTSMDYYIEATDNATPANVAREPAMAPVAVHSFSVVAIDRTAPTIVHTPVSNGQLENSAVTVSADVSDPSGVATVTLFYRTQGAGSYTSVAMSGATTHVAQIPAAAVQTAGVEYYIQATDAATPTANTGLVPTSAPGTPYTFTVSMIDTAPPTISHTPLVDGQRPNAALNISVDIVDGSGISIADIRYRTIGQTTWNTLALSGSSPAYTAMLPAAAVQAPGLEYYFEAADNSTNVNVASLPANAPAGFFSFTTGVVEVEPNNTSAQASPFLSSTNLSAIALGAIASSSDRDFYIVDVPMGPNGARYNVTAETTSGGVGSCGVDTRMRLYATDGTTVLVNDDLDGVGSCSLVSPTNDTGARALAPGRYYIAIEEDGQNSTIAGYELRGALTPTMCGNGILEAGVGELCDDNNTSAGDGCSPTCQLEVDGTFNPPSGTQNGAISPAGDTDLYAVVVTEGAYLSAETSDGSGGCNGDTFLELYAPDGTTLIGSDDDGGQGYCSFINPANDTFAAMMTAGTYYLRVRGYSATTVVSSYVLDVSVTPNFCGNSTVETGEQCDDGNSTAADGCSDTCQWETAGTASGTGASFTGSIMPTGNVDWYAVVVPAGHSIRAETLSSAPSTCTIDTRIRVFSPDRTTEIANDADDGVSYCSLLDPATDTAVRNLAAGTYYVTVEEYGNNSTINNYVLDVAIQAPVCGDGFVSGGESCDDGNTMAGDGCSAVCAFEGTGESEPNDATGTADVLLSAGTSATVFGTLATAGDDDVYSVVVPAGMHLFAEVVAPDGGCPVNSTLRLLSPTGTQLVSDSQDGPDSCGRIAPGADTLARNLSGGTYYLEVSGSVSTAVYQLNVRVLTPGCGDMYLEAMETCDDGNTTAGDGCSATCAIELMEMEPNATSSAAHSLASGIGTLGGAIMPAGDEDWFAVTLPAGSRLGVHTNGGARDQCNGVDTILEIYDPMGTQLASDDSGGPNFCSSIFRNEAGVLPAGTYRIRVRGYRSSDTFDYVLMLE